MSTILEALRKSERARRAGQAPAYGNASEPPAPSLLRWGTIFAGVALLAALVVFAWLLQRRPPEIAIEVAPVTPEPAMVGAPVTPVSPPAADVTTATPAPPAAAKPEIRKSEARNEPARPTPPPVPQPVSKAPPVAAASPAGEVQPWSSVPEATRAGLPPLRVNIHVYTPDETRRILYIDNEPRVRGEEVAPGVIVDEIVPEGAIIRFRGQRYLLPRPT